MTSLGIGLPPYQGENFIKLGKDAFNGLPMEGAKTESQWLQVLQDAYNKPQGAAAGKQRTDRIPGFDGYIKFIDVAKVATTPSGTGMRLGENVINEANQIFDAAATIFFPSCANLGNARAQGAVDFTMTLKVKNKICDPSKPLVADVIVKNEGRKSFYIGYKCDFGFAGYLTHRMGAYETIRYEIRWDKSSEHCPPKREDFIKVPAGKAVRVRLTSVTIKELGDHPRSDHPKGSYLLLVRYGTSKIAPFDQVFLGTSATNKVRLYVK